MAAKVLYLCCRFEPPRPHYENMDMDPKMPSPAKIRWIGAFQKVCAQLNEVSHISSLFFSVVFFSFQPVKVLSHVTFTLTSKFNINIVTMIN